MPSTPIPFIKRLFDLLITISALVILSPVLLVIMLAIWIVNGRPVIFSQARPGLKGKIFNLYKFRTMCEAYDAQGHPLPDAQRLTRLGKFLRTSSLDELPELININKR